MKVEKEIQEVIDTLKPYLIHDGGDIKFNRYENGVVYISLLGSCSTCPYANETINNVVAETLISKIPEIIKVVNEE